MEEKKDKAAFICSKDTLDGAYPSLVLGINAARIGMESKIFYTFMGLNLVLKGGVEKAKFIPPGVMGAIPGMAAVATKMMKGKIEKANIPKLAELMEMAQLEGVRFLACKTSVDLFDLTQDDFIEGVEITLAEDFMKQAAGSDLHLVF